MFLGDLINPLLSLFGVEVELSRYEGAPLVKKSWIYRLSGMRGFEAG